MVKLSKRMAMMKKDFDCFKKYEILEGILLLKKLSSVNFIESLDVAVHLNINPKKSEQNIRGNVFLPHGLGRDIRVIVFAQGVNVRLAKEAGAYLAGLDDLVDYVKNKKNKFDVVVATPDVMKVVSQLGSVLGPRGLMPNLKVGTVSQDIGETIKKIKLGQIRYRNDKCGIVHVGIGKISFDARYLKENIESFILDLKKNRPSQTKGIYIKKIILSSTMGLAVNIDQSTLI